MACFGPRALIAVTRSKRRQELIARLRIDAESLGLEKKGIHGCAHGQPEETGGAILRWAVALAVGAAKAEASGPSRGADDATQLIFERPTIADAAHRPGWVVKSERRAARGDRLLVPGELRGRAGERGSHADVFAPALQQQVDRRRIR